MGLSLIDSFPWAESSGSELICVSQTDWQILQGHVFVLVFRVDKSDANTLGATLA